ncbi:hypothetical protein L6164_036248 [Bauhinia variegata]|uniref:Uncharacterized protein n=1 Tax=Bauhinia variegata TaxID=167791 RepID=A0ACB9KH85_BAUVA|nr:hypothetical protein L6164_036248 [Bauhinia variegata]
MESRKKGSKPKLERRNAMKNIDYRVPDTLAFDESTSASSRTSSFDLSPSLENLTSFRVQGFEGEFENILRSLGLSGPEDFEIPTEDWEAQKARYPGSWVKTKSMFEQPEYEIAAKFESGVGLNSHNELKNARFQVSEKQLDVKINVSSDSKALRCDKDGGGGIKGPRPPVLAPPPVILRPLADNVSSTWDLMRSFAPQDDVVVESPIGDGAISSSGEEDRVIEENEEVLSEVGHRESNLFSGSSSFTSRDDDSDVGKASGTGDESIYNTSPNGSFRCTFPWQKGELLGKGSFGTVYEGFTDDGFFFAVKEVSLLDQGSQGKQSIFQLQQEIFFLGQFQHENIVRYLGTDKDECTLYIFLELMTKGSLQRLYQKYRLRDSQVSAYTRQILHGLKYLHDRNVVHRDIKCANILVDASGFVKLADFGLAKATKLNDVKSSKGTPFWMAPEVVNLKNRGYGLAADIWSLGCTVLEMLTQRPPYSHLEGMQALFRIGRGELPEVPDSLSKDARDFICECLQINPNRRPTAAELLNHPFLKRPLLSPFSPASPHVRKVQFL